MRDLELDGEPATNVVVSRTQNHGFLTTLATGNIALRQEVLEVCDGINMDRQEAGGGNRLPDLNP